MFAPTSTETYYRGKVVIVTGGTSGIGRELVVQLAGYGAVLYVCGRNPVPGEDLVRELRAKGFEVSFRSVDVQDALAVEGFVAGVLRDEGRVDVLFHCAGIIMGGEIRDHCAEDIRDVLTTNVLGTAYMTFYVYRKMAEQNGGHIVNLASVAGLIPIPLMGVYSASKFAVYGFTEALRMEGKGLGVRVSSVAPGVIDTPIYDNGIYSKTSKQSAKGLLKKRLFTMQPNQAARKILRGTARNRAVIFTQFYGRAGWASYRYFPRVYRWMCRFILKPYRRRLREDSAEA